MKKSKLKKRYKKLKMLYANSQHRCEWLTKQLELATADCIEAQRAAEVNLEAANRYESALGRIGESFLEELDKLEDVEDQAEEAFIEIDGVTYQIIRVIDVVDDENDSEGGEE